MIESEKTGEVFLATIQSQSQFSPVEQLRDKIIVNITGGPKRLYVIYKDSHESKLQILALHSSAFDELNQTTSDFYPTPLTNNDETQGNSNPLNQISDISSVKQSGNLSVVLDSRGDVYTFGFGNYGALGQGTTVFCPGPKKLTQLENKNTVEIVCGEGHGLALNKHGDVYCWGRGFEGQLGMGHIQCIPFPRLLAGLDRLGFYDNNDQSDKKIVKNIGSFAVPNIKSPEPLQLPDVIEKSSSSNVMEQKENRLDNRLATTLAITLSRGHSKSQEDTYDLKPIHKHAASMNFTARAHSIVEEPKRDIKSHRPSIADPLALENALTAHVNRIPKTVFKQIKVRKIYAADHHSFAITTLDHLYGWGDNLSGQLGIKNASKIFEPKMIELPEKISHLSTSKTHTLILTVKGHIFASGLNTFHQTGLGLKTVYKTFEKLEHDGEGARLPTFKLVETSTCYSIAVSNENGIYYWGKCFLSTAPQTYPKRYFSNLCPQVDFLFANQTNILLLREITCEETPETHVESLKQVQSINDMSSKSNPNILKLSWNMINVEARERGHGSKSSSRQSLAFRKSMMTPRQIIEIQNGQKVNPNSGLVREL